jgi:hypothetical protein
MFFSRRLNRLRIMYDDLRQFWTLVLGSIRFNRLLAARTHRDVHADRVRVRNVHASWNANQKANANAFTGTALGDREPVLSELDGLLGL